MIKSNQEYIEQIEDSIFNPLADKLSLWQTIDEEGLVEEYDEGLDINSWEYMTLRISDEDSRGLIQLDEDIIEKFNELDIQLKEKFNMRIIDFIDYNIGQVYILRYIGQ